MRTAVRTVYYCDFCGKRYMRVSSAAKHERHCTMNPDRTCKWALLDDGPRTRHGEHSFRRGLPRWVRLRAPLTVYDISELRDRAGYCPACILAALRQSGVEYHYDYQNGGLLFDYEQEVKDYRESERELEMQEEMWEIQRGWL